MICFLAFLAGAIFILLSLWVLVDVLSDVLARIAGRVGRR